MKTRMRPKWFLWFLLLGIFLTAIAVTFHFFNKKSETKDPLLQSLDKLVAASSRMPDLYIENSFPRFVLVNVPMGGENAVDRARNYLAAYEDLYWQSDPNLKLEVQRTSGENDENVFFYQTYKGLQVFGGVISVVVDDGSILGTIGVLLPAGQVIDTRPVIERQEAEDLARADLDAPDAPLWGQTLPMIYDYGMFEKAPRDPKLVWRVILQKNGVWNLLVDAVSGEILRKESYTTAGYELDLETANGNSAANSYCYADTTDDDWIGDEDGLIEDFLYDNEAIHAWWAIKDTYFFFRNTFNRDSIDNDGMEIDMYIYAGVNNAYFYDCNIIELGSGWASYDVVVHEFTHGIIYHSSQLSISGQAGALNEVFADTMVMLADPGDWEVSEDRTSGAGSIRNYCGHPVNTMSSYDASASRYVNMGIPSTAGCKLAQGGLQNKWAGSGLGRQNMVELFYNVMVNLTETSSFMDARNRAVMLSEQNWSPQNACAVKNAFAAVELGDGDWECDGIPDPDLTDTDRDWHIDAKDNCPENYNPFQEDNDHDGIGDLCDPDDDNDLFEDSEDNCPWRYNLDQADTDHDGKGDACDDEDGDHVLDVNDNCPTEPNTNQLDMDDDEIGDACDGDMDGDGVNEWDSEGSLLDNCMFSYNPDQADTDGDGIGDGCDDCPDTPDNVTAYTSGHIFYGIEGQEDIATYPQPYQKDSDGDGIPDACDSNQRRQVEEGNESLIHIIAGKFPSLERLPLSDCSHDQDGWYSQGFKGRIVLNANGDTPYAWVSDDAGRTVGKPKIQEDQVVLDFHPQGNRHYYLNFMIPGVEGDPDPIDFKMAFDCGNSIPEIDRIDNPHKLVEPFREVPSNTLTSVPTITPTSTPTLPSPPSFTPTFGPIFGTITQDAFCRSGPGLVYDVITGWLKGYRSELDGRNAENTWLRIKGYRCWVFAGGLEIEGDINRLPILAAPLTPTPTQGSGCWVRPLTGGPKTCMVPCPLGASSGGACTP